MQVLALRWLFLAAASWFDTSATVAFPAPWYPIRLTSSKSQRWFCRPNRAPALVESQQNGCALWGRSRWLGVKPGANRSYHSDFKPDEPFGAARRQSGANHSAQSGFKLGVSPSTRSDFNPDADHLGIRISSPPNHSKRSGSSPGANHSRLPGSNQSNHSKRPGSKPGRFNVARPCIAPLLCLYSHKARMY